MKQFSKSGAAALLIMLAACSGSDQAALLEQEEKPVDALYNEALDSLLDGTPAAAAPLFEEVERQHPYSAWAVKAQIMAAYSFYESNAYTKAVGALDRFIELYPADPITEYAYYLRALCFYEQIVDVGRDAEMTQRALEAFSELLRRYPEGDYARDATLKRDLTRSHLAGKEMAVGRYYLEAGHYGAALRRFQLVANAYDTTNQVPEALYRMGEAYLALGLPAEADRSAAVAMYNYPDSIWTQRLIALLEDPARPASKGLIARMASPVLNLFD